MKEIIIENDTEFYGFLTGADLMTAAKAARFLRSKAECFINDGDLERDVVEEIVRRGGTFYTGTEAKPIVPWDMVYTDVCAASCKWLDGESRSKNPAYAEQNWLLVDIAQYMYGKYLQAKISEGTLGIEQLSENRNS